MATSGEFLSFVLDQCAGLPVRTRPMMGEYLLYYRDKLAANLCDNRMLVKDLPAARALMPGTALEPPYPGAKDMLVVEQLEDRSFLAELLEAIYPELPMPKPGKGKNK